MPQEYLDNETVSVSRRVGPARHESGHVRKLNRVDRLLFLSLRLPFDIEHLHLYCTDLLHCQYKQFLTRLESAFKTASEEGSRAGSIWLTHKRCKPCHPLLPPPLFFLLNRHHATCCIYLTSSSTLTTTHTVYAVLDRYVPRRPGISEPEPERECQWRRRRRRCGDGSRKLPNRGNGDGRWGERIRSARQVYEWV